MMQLRPARGKIVAMALALFWAAAMQAQDPAQTKREAAAAYQRGTAENDPFKQEELLCNAARIDPQNPQYVRSCDLAKRILLSADNQFLNIARDAFEADQPLKAKHFAGMVSSLDPNMHRQADDLLKKLAAPAQQPPPADTAKTQSPPPPPPGPSQSDVLAKATAAYQAGDLVTAKTAAQSITDPALKSTASILLASIEKYNAYVAIGQRQDQAKRYKESESAYRAALDLNPHVAADDLAGRIRQSHLLAANVIPPPPQPPPNPNASPNPNPDEKKKRLLDEGTNALARKDLDTAALKFQALLRLDPANLVAQQGMETIKREAGKDPAQLEETLRKALVAFYASDFDTAESRFNRYLGADGGKKKGAAYFYLGATEMTLALLDDASKRAARTKEAEEDFKQARLAGYRPIDRYVSTRVLAAWKSGAL